MPIITQPLPAASSSADPAPAAAPGPGSAERLLKSSCTTQSTTDGTRMMSEASFSSLSARPAKAKWDAKMEARRKQELTKAKEREMRLERETEKQQRVERIKERREKEKEKERLQMMAQKVSGLRLLLLKDSHLWV